MAEKPAIVVICGPTASGKTAVALNIAAQFPIEVVCADSRQVYRRMDIGTAKVTLEEQSVVPHHMLDLIDPDQQFSVAEYVDRARPLLSDIQQRGKVPCVVGGTGLYIKALISGLAELPTSDPALRQQLHEKEQQQGDGYLHRQLLAIDPVSAAQIHPNNRVRIIRSLEVYYLSGQCMSQLQSAHRFAESPFRVLQIAPEFTREELYRRIDQRSEQMLSLGLIAEVESLAGRYSAELKALQTLGYKETLGYLCGEYNKSQLLSLIQQHTRQYAKKQLTWFRKEEQIIWVDSLYESGRVLQSIENFIKR